MLRYMPTLLALYAHPDDEAFSGGVLAHYAKLGVDVHLICATRGESGKITDPELEHITDLGAQREQELRDSCAALGIHEPIFLGYHDSGRFERTQTENGSAFMHQDIFEVEAKLRPYIESLNPDVLLTFDPHGGYGHIDHLVIHRAVTALFYSSGTPKRLFYNVLPVSFAERMAQTGINQNLDPKVYGVSDATIAVKLDVSAVIEQKQASMKAHRSQMGANSRFAKMPPEYLEQMQESMKTEYFAVGGTRTPIPSFPLKGFFDGLGFDFD
ncbi:PIG-L domain-containing protein [Deinococcus roseus]|uniref:PIG-L domain-containing protein n=2 Tax=Deinococcus roseus TaxID=392414 RepID=A0ABQ2DE16_9DEIO|nr:PIG-L domain-containing protein [Deinococcus roseus]